VSAIRKDRDIMRQKLQENNFTEASKLKEISKENANLRIKLKALNEENDELREKLEHQESHQNSLVRNQTKTVSDLNTKLSASESERESLKHQNDNFYKESLANVETIANQVRKIHDLERDNQKLKFQIDELKNTNKKDLANLKIDFQNKLNEQNRSKEVILNEIEDLKTKLEIADAKIATQKRQLEDKEREILKSVSSANEENWIKINELTNEKLDLESKLQISQKDCEYKLSLLQADKEKFDEKLRSMEKHREELYKENTRLKAVLNDSENYRILLEKEQEKNRELNKKYHKLEIDASTNTGIEQELTESNLKLRNELNFYMNEIQKSKEHLNRMKDEYENRLQDMKSQYVAEKNEYQIRYNEVQTKYDKMNVKMTDLLKIHEKRKKKYQEAFMKIKSKTELLNAKIKEFKIKEQVLKESVPLEVHNKVKAQLNSIIRRHKEFKDVLGVYQLGDLNTSQKSHKVPNVILSEHSVR
jgi:chromosome segregation ATPase